MRTDGSSYFEVVRRLRTKAISREAALLALEAMGVTELLPHLHAAGVRTAGLPGDPKLLAQLLLATSVEPVADARVAGPRRLDALAGGTVYTIDPTSLKRRFAYRKEGQLRVLALHAGGGAGPRIDEEFAAAADDLPPGRFDELPDWGPPLPEEVADDDPVPTHRGKTTGHLRVDVKLVLWIPYRPNTFPVPQRLLPPNWDGTTVSPETDLALRAMLATGNPDPPEVFATRQKWEDFVATKEYRGLLFYELFACCPDERPGRWYQRLLNHGYTPAMSDVPLDPPGTLGDRVVADRENKQSAGSLAENLVLGDAGTPILPVPVPGVPDRVEDAMHMLREGAQRRNETHSPGEGRFEEFDHADCRHRTFKFGVRVGRSHNLLNFAAMGRLVSFQGSELDVQVCCSTRKVRWNIAHSPIPSAKLYINNRAVWRHDMLAERLQSVLRCFYQPSYMPAVGSELDLRVAFENPETSPHDIAGSGTYGLPLRPGCPGSVPQEWIIEN